MESEMLVNKNPRMIIVEIAYAVPASQLIYTVEVSEDANVEDAILASGVLKDFAEIDLKVNKVGIFSKLTKLTNPLHHKDRIEIYRKLIADPKAVRKQRAAEGKTMKKGQ